MATRSIIRIEGHNSAVYKHWDGYPSATYPWLASFNDRFAKARGEDAVYKFAALLRSSIIDAEQYDLGTDPFTGWGVINKLDESGMGAEYFYTLNHDGTVEVSKHYNGKPLTKEQLTKELE